MYVIKLLEYCQQWRYRSVKEMPYPCSALSFFSLQVHLPLFSSSLLFSLLISHSLLCKVLLRSFLSFPLMIHIGSSNWSNSQWALVEVACCKIIFFKYLILRRCGLYLHLMGGEADYSFIATPLVNDEVTPISGR